MAMVWVFGWMVLFIILHSLRAFPCWSSKPLSNLGYVVCRNLVLVWENSCRRCSNSPGVASLKTDNCILKVGPDIVNFISRLFRFTYERFGKKEMASLSMLVSISFILGVCGQKIVQSFAKNINSDVNSFALRSWHKNYGLGYPLWPWFSWLVSFVRWLDYCSVHLWGWRDQ